MASLTDIQRTWLRKMWTRCVGHVVYSAYGIVTDDDLADLIKRVLAVNLNKKAAVIEAREVALRLLVSRVAWRTHKGRIQLARIGRGTLGLEDVRRRQKDSFVTPGAWYELSHPMLGMAMNCDQSGAGLILNRHRCAPASRNPERCWAVAHELASTVDQVASNV